MAATRLNPASMRVIAADAIHVANPVPWLTSRFHFSIPGHYSDPERGKFGALTLLNDDLVKAQSGFPTHPHKDMEIFSYVLDGTLTHADSMGNQENLGRGCVQYMSAGTGVTHSEGNQQDDTCRWIQVWLTPDKPGHTPQYGSSSYEKADRHNRLLQVLGGTGAPPAWPALHAPNAIHLHQDANVVVSESDAGVKHTLELGPARQAYLLCMEGALDVNGARLDTRAAARIRGTSEAATGLVLETAAEGAHFMLIEMALTDD